MIPKFKKGFTLIELLLFLGLFSVIMFVLTTLFASIVQKQLEVESVSSSESDMTYILSRLQYDIGRADSLTYPANPGDADSTMDIVIGGQTFSYELNGSNLELTTPIGTYIMNSVGTTISNVSFEHIGNVSGNPTVRISMNVTSVAADASGPETATINTTISVR